MYGVIHGRLTRDPEIKRETGRDGKEWVLCKFSVAVDNAYPRSDTSFFDCYIWGKKAEALIKFFKKGSEIVVSGDLRQEPYDKDGKTYRPWRFEANSFDFCGKKEGGDTSGEGIHDSFDAIGDGIPF